MPIVRTPLRDQVYREILQRIYLGTLAPGARVSDLALSSILDVSRTPVREALLQLAMEGILDADAGKGFTVRPLSATEVTEIYPMLWTLECLALRSSVPLSDDALRQLEVLNRKLVKHRGLPEQLIALDDEWHETLLSGCGNRRLLELICAMKHGVRRYEFAYMRHAGHVTKSVQQHTEILDALRANNLSGAAQALERNWSFGMHELLRWCELTSPPALHSRPRATG